MQAIQHLREL